jgi:hypothetical protein
MQNLFSFKVPLSERLSAFESQTSTGQLNTDQKQQSLSADSLVTLLTQGLQSSDTTLLDVSKFLNKKNIKQFSSISLT